MMNLNFYKQFSLEGKTALVTGASSGIGFSIAESLSNLGAKIIAVGRNKENLIKLVNLLFGEGHQIIQADLTSSDDVLHLQECLSIAIPEIIILNANPRLESAKLEKQKFNLDEFSISSGFSFLFPILSNLLSKQREIGYGRWVGISSINSVMGGEGQSMYMMQKKILESFLLSIAIEESKYGITSNVIMPGIIATESIEQNYPESLIKTFSNMNLIGRGGYPIEISSLVAYLCTNLSSFITGVKIPVTGGYELGWGIEPARKGKLFT
jgi:NAD(P)-dependent dehydrogenase (short-subunit alcohol dehydrogenase family)